MAQALPGCVTQFWAYLPSPTVLHLKDPCLELPPGAMAWASKTPPESSSVHGGLCDHRRLSPYIPGRTCCDVEGGMTCGETDDCCMVRALSAT
jgi:hypothetical protein